MSILQSDYKTLTQLKSKQEHVDSRLILSFLGIFGDALAQRGQTQQDGVPLVRLRVTELLVGPVKPVQHTQNSIALIEPEEKRVRCK